MWDSESSQTRRRRPAAERGAGSSSSSSISPLSRLVEASGSSAVAWASTVGSEADALKATELHLSRGSQLGARTRRSEGAEDKEVDGRTG